MERWAGPAREGLGVSSQNAYHLVYALRFRLMSAPETPRKSRGVL